MTLHPSPRRIAEQNAGLAFLRANATTPVRPTTHATGSASNDNAPSGITAGAPARFGDFNKSYVRRARKESCIDPRVPLGDFTPAGRPEKGPTALQYYLAKSKRGESGTYDPLWRCQVAAYRRPHARVK